MIKQFTKWGIILGVLLAVFNTISLGILGVIWLPILNYFQEIVQCHEEGCLMPAIVFTDILFILIIPLFFVLAGLITDKILNKK